MTRVLIGCIALTAIAAVVAWQLGGSVGGGVLTGALVGTGITGLCLLYQREVMRTRPAAAMQAFGIAMLIKLAVLLLGTLAFRYVEPAALRVDWQSFMIAYAASVALVLPLGTLDAVRVMQTRKVSVAPKASSMASAEQRAH